MDKILVVDLECCCWEPRPHGVFGEIIEIGYTEINMVNRTLGESKGIIVLPTTETVSEFCTELTTLTPEFVAQNGISFKNAINELKKIPNLVNIPWASYGMFDKNKIVDQCMREGIPYPMSLFHINIKDMVTEKLGRRMGMESALEHFVMDLEGTHHRGVDDSRNIAKMFLKMTE